MGDENGSYCMAEHPDNEQWADAAVAGDTLPARICTLPPHDDATEHVYESFTRKHLGYIKATVDG